MTRELLQQALDALLGYKPHSLTHAKEQGMAIIALREALAQPVQPAGQLCEDSFGRGQVMWFNKPLDGAMLYASAPVAQPEQPEQRLWVGLTDEELLDIADLAYANDLELMHQVQAKLKEKNI